jgi:hypothetical protein
MRGQQAGVLEDSSRAEATGKLFALRPDPDHARTEVIMQPAEPRDLNQLSSAVAKLFADHPELAESPGWAEFPGRVEAVRTWIEGIDQSITDFQTRHAGNPWLGDGPVYSLSQRLLDLLVDGIPDFFTEEEESFEQDLTTLTRGGLLLRGKVLRYPLTDGMVEEMAAGVALSFALAKMALLTAMGLNNLQIEAQLQRQEEIEREAELRAAAYAGWLVTDSTFQKERDELRSAWGRRLDGLGVVCGLGPRPDDGDEDPAIHDFREFLERWVLAGLLAWDLPCPLTPEFLGVSQLDPRTRFYGGVHLFLPWYLLKDKHFQLQEIAELHGPNVDRRHLRPWFAAATKNKRVGQKRYGHGLQLYRFWALVLEQRYPERLKGNVEKLRGVFSEYLELGTDSVKKLRQRLKFSRSRPPA